MNSTTPAKISRSNVNARIWLVTSVVVIAFVLLGLTIFLVVGTDIRGTEFSPQTFQIRSFSYKRLPGTKVRLTATKLANANSIAGTSVLQHLNTQYATPRWDVVQASSGSTTDIRSAKLLVDLLATKNANSQSFWDTWSKDNPAKAKVLWPAIQQAAADELYIAIPSMLNAALDAETPADVVRDCTAKADYYRNLGSQK